MQDVFSAQGKRVLDRLASQGGSLFAFDFDGTLARIVLLDQFPRNMFRDDARAFSTDAMALDAANEPRLTALGLNDVAGFQSLILTPLVVQDHIAGLLIFGHTAPGAFTGANEPALLATANMAASVLYNAILFDRVHNESSEREAILRSIASRPSWSSRRLGLLGGMTTVSRP